MKFVWCSLAEWQQNYMAQWQDVSAHAEHPIYYLTPEFICAATALPCGNINVASCWSTNESGEVCQAIAFFEDLPSPWYAPWRRVRCLASKHSFESGVLMRAGAEPSTTLDILLSGVFKHAAVIRFAAIGADTTLATHLQEQLTAPLMHQSSYQRAVLTNPSAALDSLSKKRHKKLRRALNKLQEQGHVTFTVVEGTDFDCNLTRSFLHLEASGRKADTAIQASQEDEAFFKQLVTNAACSNTLFATVLMLDNEPIGITINFHQADQAFAFKVAYDAQYAQFSPGILNEYLTLGWFAERGLPWQRIDSGAYEGSYIDDLWPDRRTMLAGDLLQSPVIQLLYRFKGRRQQTPSKIASATP